MSTNRVERTTSKEPSIRKLSKVKSKRLKWLWGNRIPLGKVTLLVGDPGVGKSFLTIFLAAQVSRGPHWPDHPQHKEQVGSVIILTLEDDLADTVRCRLDAAGANVRKVAVIDVRERIGEAWERRPIYNLNEDFEVLAAAIEKIGDVRLIILDPINGFMGNGNSNKDTEVRSFLAPLAKLAAKHDLAIVGISHLCKKPDVPAAYRTLGSIAFVAAARAVWLVAEDPEDEDRRLFLPVKGNLCRKPTGLAFRLSPQAIETDEGPLDSYCCEFEEDQIHMSADEALSANAKRLNRPTALEEAKDWLQSYLADGPTVANEVYACAKDANIKKKTLERAKTKLGVRSYQDRTSKPMQWKWRLPDAT
jgi:hypothetical protein